jgi:sterol desaturase/sphingolipid hydroxylase (fatty acid hydroxylase superfamily)
MDEEREYGPATSLRRRRMWGLLGLSLAILFIVLASTLDMAPDQPAQTVEAWRYEPPSVWIFAAGSLGIFAVALVFYWLLDRPKDD